VHVAERLLEQRRRAHLAGVLPLVRVLAPVRGHHHHHHVGRHLAHGLEQPDAVETGHPDVGEHRVQVLAPDNLLGGQAVGGNHHLEAIALEQDAQPLAHRLLIVHNQNSRHAGSLC
jgi:hypothetical protein